MICIFLRYRIYCTRIGYYLIRYLIFEGATYHRPPRRSTTPHCPHPSSQIIPVPYLASSYANIIIDTTTNSAVVIDPGSHINVDGSLSLRA